MNTITKLKTSIEDNFRIWIIFWFLILLNAYTFISLSRGFTWLVTFSFLILAFLGVGLFRILAKGGEEDLITLPELKANIDEVMQEITPLCDNIFARETVKAIDPIIERLRQEFSKGLTWLWENMDEFINSIENNMSDVDSVLQLFSSLNDDKFRLIDEFQNSITAIDNAILQVNRTKAEDFAMLSESLNIQRENLMESMEKEKYIFYQHIYKILMEQKEIEPEFNPVEHFNTYKLGDQFTGLINKSLQEKLEDFYDNAIKHLEDFSSDVVGRMQKNTTNLLNVFRDNQAVLERLLNESKGESNLLLRRIDELMYKNEDLQEKAAQILVTLAWQDILVEKRWGEAKEKLYLVRDFVQNSVEEDVFDYIKNVVEQEIPGISYMVKQPEGAVFYKSLLDAELIYQVFIRGKLNEVLEDGVKVLLQFVRPVELLANHSIRLNEQGLKQRKDLRKKAKTGEFNEIFHKINTLVAQNNADLAGYLEDIFPREFYAFCNSPYIKKKPDNLNSAAWSIFLSLIEKEESEEVYILTGLLLVVHKLRNKYIHPLKNSFIELEDIKDLEVIRYATYQIINLIINNELKGTTSLSYKYK